MKSLTPSSSAVNFSSDICVAQYQPNNSLFLSKSTNLENILTFFDKKKVQLSTDSNVSSKTTSLQGKTVLVTLDLNCHSELNSLSEKVLFQNSADSPPSFNRHAYKYNISEAIYSEDLSVAAQEDPCVVGITRDGLLNTSSLNVNDPRLSQQTHIQDNFSHAYEYLILKQNSSNKVQVGFVDTGSDCSHSDLQSNLTSNCGFDAISGSTPTDNDGHGSHTMGLTGAVMNNSIGITGLAGNAIELHAIRVINVSNGTVADAYEGIQYAISHHLDVINISLESQERLIQIENGVQEAVAAGVVVVMAAGNQGGNLGESVQVSPALVGKTLLGAITVGSIDVASGLRSQFSNFGNNVEIYAPGAYDSSLSGEGAGGLLSLNKNNGYQHLMGTSQATPIITAAAAMTIQFLKQRGVSYSPADIEKIIEASTTQNIDGIGSAGALDWGKLVRSVYSFAGQGLCGD